MLFNSYIFTLCFLPLSVIAYFFLNRYSTYTRAKLFLIGMSLWFYGYFNYKYLYLIIVSLLFNFCTYKGIKAYKNNKRLKRICLMIGVLFNLGTLFYFKYFGFFTHMINSVFKIGFTEINVLLPLGISFFTFQQLSFVVDCYTNDNMEYSFIDYALFVTFFPQLIAGPIVLHHQLIPQFKDKDKKSFNFENFSKGMYSFSMGLGKKVLIADTLAILSMPLWNDIHNLNTTSAIIITLSYTFQVYFDFSGYSDMARGIGYMFNINLPINFNSPYKSLTITEFWSRWHITLSGFLKQYLYIPLGGNRKGNLRTYVNLFIVFLASGLWHGANYTFILWGFLHGIMMIYERLFKKYVDKRTSIFSWIVTFAYVNICWIFFRADSISDAMIILGSFLKRSQSGTDIAVTLCALLVFCLIVTLNNDNVADKTESFRPTILNSLITATILIACILSFSRVSQFLYFNF